MSEQIYVKIEKKGRNYRATMNNKEVVAEGYILKNLLLKVLEVVGVQVELPVKEVISPVPEPTTEIKE